MQLLFMKPLENTPILIADDYEINCHVLLLFIKRLGLTADTAENGKMAFEKYKEKQYGLIFMDLMMPDTDGYEATKLIRQYEKDNNLPPAIILAVSADYLGDSEKKLLDNGFDKIISKPFVFDKMTDVLSDFFTF